MRKILAGALAAVVVAIAATSFYLYRNLDAIVKNAVERDGSKLLGTKVSVRSVSVSASSGEGTLRGLTIANPPGYKGKNAFEADRVTLGLDLHSLRTPVVVVNKLLLDAPKLFVEHAGPGRTNLRDLQKNLESSGDEPEQSKAGGEPKKLIVDLFKATGGQVVLTGEGAKSTTVPLAPLSIQGLGRDAGGVPPKDLLKPITKAIIVAAGEESQPVKQIDAAVKGAKEYLYRARRRLQKKR